jgi:hypothetical protein
MAMRPGTKVKTLHATSLTNTDNMTPYFENGLWYYPELPENMHQASILDFTTPDNKLKTGVKFLIQGNDGIYESHISNETFYEKHLNALSDGRIYVK